MSKSAPSRLNLSQDSSMYKYEHFLPSSLVKSNPGIVPGALPMKMRIFLVDWGGYLQYGVFSFFFLNFGISYREEKGS